jgi:hypothetical protein
VPEKSPAIVPNLQSPWIPEQQSLEDRLLNVEITSISQTGAIISWEPNCPLKQEGLLWSTLQNQN